MTALYQSLGFMWLAAQLGREAGIGEPVLAADCSSRAATLLSHMPLKHAPARLDGKVAMVPWSVEKVGEITADDLLSQCTRGATRAAPPQPTRAQTHHHTCLHGCVSPRFGHPSPPAWEVHWVFWSSCPITAPAGCTVARCGRARRQDSPVMQAC